VDFLRVMSEVEDF